MQLLKKMKKYFEKSHVFKDTELIELFTDCEYGHHNTPMNTECIYKTAKNICTICILDYYKRLMSPDFYCCSYCVSEYKSIIFLRFGSTIEENYL